MPSQRARWRRILGALGAAGGVLLLGCVLALGGSPTTSAPEVIWSTQPPRDLSDVWVLASGSTPTGAALTQQDAVAIARQVEASPGGDAATWLLLLSETTVDQADAALSPRSTSGRVATDTPVCIVTLRGGPFLPWHSLPILEAERMQTTALEVVIDACSGQVLRVSGVR